MTIPLSLFFRLAFKDLSIWIVYAARSFFIKCAQWWSVNGVGVVAAVGVRNMIVRYLIVGHRWEVNSIIGNDVVYCYVCKG